MAEEKSKRRIVIIPAYEPPNSFIEYARKLSQTVDKLIVVNDGSDTRFQPVFDEIGALSNAAVISYGQNHGKGYALKQAFSYCAEHFAEEDILVTADCDGQHSLGDVKAVCDAAAHHPESYVLGVRDFGHPNVPPRSKAGNTQMLRLFRLLYAMEITDSQTGLRACTAKTAQAFLKVSGNRFEYETGTLIFAKRNHIPIREVSIQTIYPENKEDHVSHFKTFRDSCRVVGIMLRYLLGSMISGLLATATDLGVFSLLTYVVFPKTAPGYTMIATVLGRIASSVINFWFNCKYVFHGKPKRSLGRFYIVWAGQVICSYGNIYLFGHVLGGHLTLMKLIGDCVLALLTYRLQCSWVYEEPKEEGFYGSFARFGRWLLRTFSPRYKTDLTKPSEPVVYVCRHLNMHGPFTTLKWLPFHVHPMILHVYFDKEKTVKHMTEYTFSARYGKKPKKFSLAAHVMSWVSPPMMASLQGIPVYRNGIASISTLKTGLKYLLKGECLIVYPDIDYTGNYGKPSEIYDGFLMLGDMYLKKTGKALTFVPLVIDDEHRHIIEGKAVCVSNFRQECAGAADYLKRAINKEEISCDHDIVYSVAANQQPVCKPKG